MLVPAEGRRGHSIPAADIAGVREGAGTELGSSGRAGHTHLTSPTAFSDSFRPSHEPGSQSHGGVNGEIPLVRTSIFLGWFSLLHV